MSRGLAALIRLGRWRLDGIRRRIVDAEARKVATEQAFAGLAAAIAAEQCLAAEEEWRFAYGAFAGRAAAERLGLADRLAAVEQELGSLRAGLEEEFRILKRYELAAEQASARAAAEAARLESAEEQEIALQGFRRKRRS